MLKALVLKDFQINFTNFEEACNLSGFVEDVILELCLVPFVNVEAYFEPLCLQFLQLCKLNISIFQILFDLLLDVHI